MYEMHQLEDHLVKMVPKFERICSHIKKNSTLKLIGILRCWTTKLILAYMLRHSVMSDSLRLRGL